MIYKVFFFIIIKIFKLHNFFFLLNGKINQTKLLFFENEENSKENEKKIDEKISCSLITIKVTTFVFDYLNSFLERIVKERGVFGKEIALAILLEKFLTDSVKCNFYFVESAISTELFIDYFFSTQNVREHR